MLCNRFCRRNQFYSKFSFATIFMHTIFSYRICVNDFFFAVSTLLWVSDWVSVCVCMWADCVYRKTPSFAQIDFFTKTKISYVLSFSFDDSFLFSHFLFFFFFAFRFFLNWFYSYWQWLLQHIYSTYAICKKYIQ